MGETQEGRADRLGVTEGELPLIDELKSEALCSLTCIYGNITYYPGYKEALC